MTLLDLQMYELISLEVRSIIFKILNSHNTSYQTENIKNLYLNINQLISYIESRGFNENTNN